MEAIRAVDSLGALVVDTDLYSGILDRGLSLQQRDQLIALLIVDVGIASALRSLLINASDWSRYPCCCLRLVEPLLVLL